MREAIPRIGALKNLTFQTLARNRSNPPEASGGALSKAKQTGFLLNKVKTAADAVHVLLVVHRVAFARLRRNGSLGRLKALAKLAVYRR